MPRTPSKAMAPRLASPSRLEPRSTRRGVKQRPPGHFTHMYMYILVIYMHLCSLWQILFDIEEPKSGRHSRLAVNVYPAGEAPDRKRSRSRRRSPKRRSPRRHRSHSR